MASPKKKWFTRRRLALLIVLLAIVGCVLAAGSVLQTLLTRQQETERQNAEKTVNELLAQTRRLADHYTRAQLAAREKIARQLTLQATALCGEVQVFLQSAVVRREAQQTGAQNLTLQQKRDALREIANEHLTSIAALLERVKVLEQEKLNRLTSPLIISFGETAPQETAAAPEPAALPDVAAERERLLNYATVAGEPDDPQWLEKLLNECSIDFQNFLPKNSQLVIAEVGKPVLLTLGDGIITPDEVIGAVSLPLLLRENGDSRQLILNLALADVEAPALPSPAGLAAMLASSLPTGGQELRGFVIDDDDVVLATFPENAGGVRVLLPTDRAWNLLPTAQAAAYYQTLNAMAADANYPWRVGLQITITQPPDAARLTALAAEHPVGAMVLAVAGLLLLLAFILAAALSWSSGAAPLTARPAIASAENLTPQLDSLKRLQLRNRLHAPASKILQTTKSKVLRELVQRVSPAPPAAKPAVKHLREYR